MTSLRAEAEGNLAIAVRALLAEAEVSAPVHLIEALRTALSAWERGGRAVPSGPRDMLRACPPNPPQTITVGGALMGTKSENEYEISRTNEKEKDSHERESSIVIEQSIERLYAVYLDVLKRHEQSRRFPSPSRANPKPGPRVVKILTKALAEAPEEQVALAIRGAFAYWVEHGTGRKSLTDVFATFRNTGSLLSRIDFFAGLSPSQSEYVRGKVEDVRREIRAAIDRPTPASLRRARASEQWLRENGMSVVIDGRAFSIVGHVGPAAFDA